MPKDPEPTRVAPTLLLTNDDGIDEPGLEALRAAAGTRGRIYVVAPIAPHSNCSHAVTTHRPLRVHRRGEDRLGIDGTPADCVRLALHGLVPGPAWVLAGINAGGNLGMDMLHSGTVAAAREAALHGVPAIALSHYRARGRAFDWPRAVGWAERVLELLLRRPSTPGTFWNVNFPHPGPDDPEPEIVECAVDPSPLPLRYRVEGEAAFYDGDYHARRRIAGRDVDVCFRGNIAVCLVPVAFGDTRLVNGSPATS